MRARLSSTTLAFVLALSGCTQKKDDEPKPSGDGGPNTQLDGGGTDAGGNGKDSSVDPVTGAKTAISGVVSDVVGSRIAGAEVTLGLRSVKSGANGEFSFGMVTLNEQQETLHATREGFSPGRLVFTPASGASSFLKLTLQPAEQVMLQDVAAGGAVATTSGAMLMLPANAVVDENGVAVTGPVAVSVALINDRDEMAAAPPMVATDPQAAEGAAPAELESFGMVSINLTADGKPVQLAPGVMVDVSFPMGAGTKFAEGELVGLWNFDETEQMWKSAGDGTVDAQNVFHAVVSHFSWWNADQVMTKTCVRSRVLDAQGQPVGGANVTGEGRSYMGNTHATTDMQGNFCLEARVSSVIEVSSLVRVGTQDQALALRVNTPRTQASCAQPTECYELPNPLVAIADMPLCQPSACPQDPNGIKQACCQTDIGPCKFIVNGDCGGAEDGMWDPAPENPGVEEIPGVPIMPVPQTDAGTDSGVQPEPDAGLDGGNTQTDAGIDAGQTGGSGGNGGSGGSPASGGAGGGTAPLACGPFFQSACMACVANSCNSGASGCFGPDWRAGTFEGACTDFIQCLCDLPISDPSGCDATQNSSCKVCLAPVDDCIQQNCGDLCGDDGGNPGGTPVERCADVEALTSLSPVSGTTVGSDLLNDWWDDGACSQDYDITRGGYLPGKERSYSLSVPAGATLRARVSGAGMVVLIATSCEDIDLSCQDAGNTASYTNASDEASTVVVTVDHTAVDGEGPFTLTFSTGAPACGDGFRDEGENEICDDGNTTPGDGCGANCQVEDNWSCPGDAPCYPVVCGDGIRESGNSSSSFESCDDGNDDAGDGCNSSCDIEPYYICDEPNTPCRHVECGDGVIDWQFEYCDDGNAEAGDGCDQTCQPEPGWECGKVGEPCVQTVCGDGLIGWQLEECDDNNTTSGDGCNQTCQLEDGWICTEPGEACRLVVCGDDIVDWGVEGCEDGNTVSGDGCSSMCMPEPGYLCDGGGANCVERAAGDLCNNALALPATSTGTYGLTGMTGDSLGCGQGQVCPVTRWFSVTQQPGETTAVRITGDFQGLISFETGGCSYGGGGTMPGGSDGFNFDPGKSVVTGSTNEGDAARTLYFVVGGAAASGEFELILKTGPGGCGDGLRGFSQTSGYEECDDFNTDNGDGCSSTCEIEPGWRCPYEAGGACVQAECGDGWVDYGFDHDPNLPQSSWGEQCDDGNTDNGDGCDAYCQLEPGAICKGNPSKCEAAVPGELCSNAVALPLEPSTYDLADFEADGESTDLWFTRVLQPREQLVIEAQSGFDGTIVPVIARGGDCQYHQPIGDGDSEDTLQAGQSSTLRATNTSNAPATVLIWVVSQGAVSGSITLDASVGIPAQDCSNGPCVDMVCGDSTLTGSEQCDDGGTVDGDGCSANCVREVGYSCSGEPSECEPMLAGDACEVAVPLADGTYDFVGYTPDPTCDIGCEPFPTRWFEIEVPANQTLVAWFTTSTLNSAMARFIDHGGNCNYIHIYPDFDVYFNDRELGYAAWINRAPTPRTIAIGVVAQSEDPVGDFTLDMQLGESGCGDGFTDESGHLGAGEQCDDANTVSGDGCSSTCTREVGYDCDRGRCTPIVCGDGIKAATEGCDDANMEGGDGCSATCTVEEGYLCGGSPSECFATQPGDQCLSAQPLGDGSYSLTSFLPDIACENLCTNGVDRWFQVEVPPGETLGVTVEGEMSYGQVWLRDGCGSETRSEQRTIGAMAGAQTVFWMNDSAVAQHVAVAVTDVYDTSDAGFTISHTLRPSGCGDYQLDDFGPGGSLEQCDDGNTISGDGCSSVCGVEGGYVCYGRPSTCLVPLAGDVCGTAQTLAAGAYSLDGYLPTDLECGHCDGADRWFTTTVPPHTLIDVLVSSGAPNAVAELYLKNAPDCDFAMQLGATGVSQDDPSHDLYWLNDSDDPAVVLVRVGVQQPGLSSVSFNVTYTTVVPACGDGFVDYAGEFGENEQCDDGNTVAGDGCSETCSGEAGFVCQGFPSVCASTCGDWSRASDEGCEDGNLNGGDGCSPTCEPEAGYECTGSCNPICGDGLVVGYEGCDDGNTDGEDGCGTYCTIVFGYTCAGTPSVCTTTCGDTITAGAEACDDGNTTGGDGCSETCTTE